MESPVTNTQTNQQHIIIIAPNKNHSNSITSKLKKIMKKLKSIFGICVIAVMIASCEKEENISPTPTKLDCEINNWAYVYFENRSNSNTKFDVYWNGSRIIKNLAPGQKSQKFTFSASNHTYSFKIANTNTLSC